MKIYRRYIFLRFLGLFFLCLISITAVFVIIDAVGKSKDWLSRDPSEMHVYYFNYVPHIVYLICPLALLLAAVFSVGSLAKHFELTALKASGISAGRALFPLVLFGALVTVGIFFMSETVLPEANHARFQINEPKSSDENGSGDPLEKFNFIYTSSDREIFFFEYYSGKRQSGQGVTVLKHQDGKLVRRIDARSLSWDDGWLLRDGAIRNFPGSGLQAEKFKEYALTEFRDHPGELLDTRVHADEMDLGEIARRVAVLERSGEQAAYWSTQWHFRFSASVVNFLMVLIGVSMSANAIRTGLARNFGFALLFTFLYYVTLRLGLIMGENATLHPALGAWFGNILFGPVGLLLYWKAARS